LTFKKGEVKTALIRATEKIRGKEAMMGGKGGKGGSKKDR